MRILFCLCVCVMLFGQSASAQFWERGNSSLQTVIVKAPASGVRGDGAIPVTSDSAEYCAKLTRTVAGLLQTPHEVPAGAMEDARRLWMEGDTLCRHHHLRSGIGRLRRALILLEKSGDHS